MQNVNPSSKSIWSSRWCVGMAAALIALPVACRLKAPEEIVAPPKKTPDAGIILPTDGGTKPTIEFSKAGLINAIAECSMNHYSAFATAVQTLKEKTAAYAADRSAENLTAARNAWLAAMEGWQEAEGFRLGPAAFTGEPGGQGLRDEIYAWPLFSSCKVDEQVVNQAYAQNPGALLINSRGLAAVEYLLFNSSTGNTCSEFSAINANGTWAALSADELKKRRAEYAAAASNDILTRATTLTQAWDPAGGNFKAQFTNAGKGSTVYTSDQAAMNAASHALFYLEQEVKDLKLGKPLGINDCLKETCPEAVESPWARTSTAHIKANLKAFRRMFEGCNLSAETLGFDDWLWAANAGELSTRMIAAIDNAETVLDGFDQPVDTALVTNRAQADNLYAAVKLISDLLKSDFITTLNLDLPKGAEGDND